MIIQLTTNSYKQILSSIEQCPSDGSYEVDIRQYEAGKTAPQHGLYFHWVGELSMQTGFTRDEIHKKLKGLYLRNIYLVDPQNKRQREWVNRYQAVMATIGDMVSEDKALIEEMAASQVSITWAKKGQMKEYLDQITRFAASRQFSLSMLGDMT